MGMGFPITGKALAHGLRFGFGCDIVSNQSGDLLTQMRLALQVQRALDNHITVESGGMAERLELTARRALEIATAGGAAAMGLDSEIGTLTPGKAADLILIRTDGLNFAPLNDPVAAVVLHAHACDVETVLVAGEIVKRDGRLLNDDAARARRLADESRDRIMSALEQRGGLLLDLPGGWFEQVRAAALQNVGAQAPES